MKKERRIWGYVRVSTKQQSVERQITNIKKQFPEAIIIDEKYSGKTMDRPAWNRLFKQLKSGDMVVFDEVSRLSRSAEEGFQTYKQLFGMGIEMVFIKQPGMNSENFRKAAQIAMTGDAVDVILQGINEYLMILCELQFKAEFEKAQYELDFDNMRTREGIRQHQEEYLRNEALGLPNPKEWGGRKKGVKVETKKAREAKQKIREYSKDFGGTVSDPDLISMCGISRNTFYEYKKQIRAELQSESK